MDLQIPVPSRKNKLKPCPTVMDCRILKTIEEIIKEEEGRQQWDQTADQSAVTVKGEHKGMTSSEAKGNVTETSV